MEKQEQFNPRDEKYKKVADLPEDQQQNFADTENGGFVKKEVLESDEGLKTEAERRNKERPVLQKLRGQNKQSFVEIAQEEAMETDKIIEKEKLAPLEAALQESFELNFMQRGIEGAKPIKILAQKYGIDIEITEEKLQKVLEGSLRESDAYYAKEIINFGREQGFEIKISKSDIQKCIELILSAENSNHLSDYLKRITNLAQQEEIKLETLDVQNILQKSSEAKLAERRYIDFLRIYKIAQKSGVELSIGAENIKNIIVEGVLSLNNFENDLQNWIEIAKNKNVDISLQKILQKACEMSLAEGEGHGFVLVKEIKKYAQEKGLRIEITKEALQKCYEKELARGYVVIIERVADFAREQEIDLDTPEEVLQKGLEANLEKVHGDIKGAKEIIRFSKEQKLDLRIEESLQKSFETQLAQANPKAAREIAGLAKSHNIQLEMPKSLEMDSCIRAFHNLKLSHAASWREGIARSAEFSDGNAGDSFHGYGEELIEYIVKIDYLDYMKVPEEQRLNREISIKLGDQSIVALFHGQRKDEPIQGKFIVGITLDKKLEFVFDGTLGEHKDIGVKYDLQVIGGGWLEIDEQNKKVRIYGSSKDFGYEPRSISRQAVAEAFAGYEAIVDA